MKENGRISVFRTVRKTEDSRISAEDGKRKNIGFPSREENGKISDFRKVRKSSPLKGGIKTPFQGREDFADGGVEVVKPARNGETHGILS